MIVYDERLRGFTEDMLRGSECGTGHDLIALRIVPGKKWTPKKKTEVKGIWMEVAIAGSSSPARESIRN